PLLELVPIEGEPRTAAGRGGGEGEVVQQGLLVLGQKFVVALLEPLPRRIELGHQCGRLLLLRMHRQRRPGEQRDDYHGASGPDRRCHDEPSHSAPAAAAPPTAASTTTVPVARVSAIVVLPVVVLPVVVLSVVVDVLVVVDRAVVVVVHVD